VALFNRTPAPIEVVVVVEEEEEEEELLLLLAPLLAFLRMLSGTLLRRPGGPFGEGRVNLGGIGREVGVAVRLVAVEELEVGLWSSVAVDVVVVEDEVDELESALVALLLVISSVIGRLNDWAGGGIA